MKFLIDLLKVVLVVAIIVAVAYFTGNIGPLKNVVFSVWDHLSAGVEHMKLAAEHFKQF